jgi:hypothetical protein
MHISGALKWGKNCRARTLCQNREYEYLIPESALHGKPPEELARLLSIFEGTHRFHNFTGNLTRGLESLKRKRNEHMERSKRVAPNPQQDGQTDELQLQQPSTVENDHNISAGVETQQESAAQSHANTTGQIQSVGDVVSGTQGGEEKSTVQQQNADRDDDEEEGEGLAGDDDGTGSDGEGNSGAKRPRNGGGFNKKVCVCVLCDWMVRGVLARRDREMAADLIRSYVPARVCVCCVCAFVCVSGHICIPK